MNSKIREIKNRIEKQEKEILMHQELFQIIEEIKEAKSKVIKYHKLMKDTTFSDDHSNYYLLCEEYMLLCKELINHLDDTLAKYDYIDSKECEELLNICYDFKYFDTSLIWDYLK